MLFDVAARVLANTPLSPDYNVIALAAPEIAQSTAPGQFVMVKPQPGLDPLLRRPFSVFEVLRDERGGLTGISLLNKRIGVGTGLLYSAEHGPSTDDELNLITAGGNYGWPFVAGYKDDRSYTYANWSASSPEPCTTLKFSSLSIPASVPQTSESSFTGTYVAPLVTFFAVPAGYDLSKSGTATIAPSGLDLYTSAAIPGWAASLIVAGLRTGAIYRAKLSRDGRRVEGEPVEYFKAATRYRDIAISPDGLRIFASTDDHGTTMDDRGQSTRVLANPGAILEFTYVAK